MRKHYSLHLPQPLRVIITLLLAALALVACQELAVSPSPVNPATFTPRSPTPAPTRTPAPSPIPTATPNNLWIEPSDIEVYPHSGLYSGDRVSFRVQVHNGRNWTLFHVLVWVTWESARSPSWIFQVPNNGSAFTDLLWVWNTESLVGTQTVTITIDPHRGDTDLTNNTAVIQVELQPAAKRPAEENGAHWQTTPGACCTFHFISETTAARDIETIQHTAEEAVAYVEDRLGIHASAPLNVYLIDRMLGHGGFAGDDMGISYLDRDYVGGSLVTAFRHEATHLLDRQLIRGDRVVMLAEGFATYIAGGHFKLEPLPERAAALLQLGAYIPLRQLIKEFYPSQHETGYLEAGAFIDYLIQRNGFEQFIKFYGDLKHKLGEPDVDLIDRGLRAGYGLGLEELESEWLTHLRTLDAGAQRRDLAATLAFYDTVRRYQRALDPSAYFRSAWIPGVHLAKDRGIVADYMRHPDEPENIILETMLVAANEALLARDFNRVEMLLGSIKAVLDTNMTFSDPIAAHYLEVVHATLAVGYEPKRITLFEDRAEVEATVGSDATLVSLAVAQQNGVWSVQLNQ
ncbi:MAG TPA: hypothetical protein VJG32_09155 [Anaerolineae bacterium]|nr:hypothetical protein [Anaerolineae bacterium]